MNERIKALKEQAFDTVWDLDKTTIGPSTHFVPEGFEQKFAELIIRECIDTVLDSSVEYCTRPQIAEELKEHFGVKE
jgi:hypothetical protein